MGRVLAVAAFGALLVACDGDEPTKSTYNVVQVVTVRPDAYGIRIGNALTFTATALGAGGQILAGKTFTWTTSNSAIATVSSTGVVTGVSVGTAKITASVEGFSGISNIEILPSIPRNFSIVDVQFTQGVQFPDGSIPMLRSGNAAVANVMLAANDLLTAQTTQVVLRLFDANNALVRTDTAVTGTLYLTTPSTSSPTVQFLIPSSVLQSGLRWQVERDPKHLFADETAADDVFPRQGTNALAMTDVPPLSVRFLPIALVAHGVQAVVGATQLPDFTRTVESVLPVATITRTLAPAFSTQATFGPPPRGGDLPFWSQILGELDLARLVDVSDRSTYWVGVVIPPPGYSSTIFGGVGFIPSNGAATGSGSRAAVLVGPGWYASSVAARDGMAHELGHNFGRSHSPCGNVPSGVDASYPIPTGTIGVPGHDVYSWAKGLAASAQVVNGETGDVMGYCARPWASPYTYDGALRFRRAGITTAISTQAARQRVLIVRGNVGRGQAAVLEPAFIATAIPTEPDAIGPYRLEGLDAKGRVLFARSFAPAVVDHAPDAGPFTFALPLTGAVELSLTTLRVIVPGQQSTVRQSVVDGAALPSAVSATQSVATLVRSANNSITATCVAPYAAGILVQHRTNGLLATNASASATFVAASGTPLNVQCSDGVRSVNS
ncbi:MAG: Ig-like domain-containing protein, partial [Gemmatimonadaceae bacterium]